MAEGWREGRRTVTYGGSPVNFDMFLEAETEAEPHLAEGAHHRLLLVGSLVHVCPAPPRQHFCRERERGPPSVADPGSGAFFTPGSGIRDG